MDKKSAIIAERENEYKNSKENIVTGNNFIPFVENKETLLIKNNAIESSINGILISDLHGIITYVNPAFLQMWDYDKKEDIIGDLMIKFWKLKGETMSIIDTILDKGYWEGKLEGEKKDGRNFNVKLTANIVKNEKQKPICILATFIDITDLEQALRNLKSSQDAFYNIVEKSIDAVLITNENGIVQFSNKEANRIFYNYEDKSMIGEHFGIPVTQGDVIEIDIYKKNVKKSGIGEMRVTDTKWKNKKASLIQIRDITEHKKIEKYLKSVEAKLKNLNKILEKRVKERTQDIEQLLEQKDQFIGQLGHDLKTPLSILMNIIPMIESEIISDDAKEDCKVAIRNVTYIKNLVNETLKIAELSSINVKLDIKESNISSIINNALKDFEMIAHAKGIILDKQFDDEIILPVDELKINEVIHNLLNNSIKFTDENGKITVKVEEDFNQTVTIIIQDNGSGMEKEELKHIFDEFYKADTSRHDLGGSGLGLSICKRIIDKHDGLIWAESEGIGKGSSFHIKLKKNQ